MAVTKLGCDAGIILTASHNPKNWNALKLLNNRGEFINDVEGRKVIKLAEEIYKIKFSEVDNLGTTTYDDTLLQYHIDEVLKLKYVDKDIIKSRNPKIIVDVINSSGSIAINQLFNSIGIDNYTIINEVPNGEFAHNPEPLDENLYQIKDQIKKEKYDIGIIVDPDVDRLCFANEDGTLFGEEYSLVAIADYILGINKGGNTVSNLSSTRALRDITIRHSGSYSASAVGEVNVVSKMKETNAIIGGEGNGGIILPELHYGRDAIVGIAIFLTYYCSKNKSMTEIKAELPYYSMSKKKIQLTKEINSDDILLKLNEKYSKTEQVSTIDGVKIDFDNGWVHIRKSNTEPILRIYSEGQTDEISDDLANKIIEEIKGYCSS